MTQAQKRAVSILLCNEDQFAMVFEAVIRKDLGDQYRLAFYHFDTETEMFRIAQERRIDLVCVYLGNVRWKPGEGDPYQRGLNALGYLKTEFGANVIATQGLPLTKQANRANIAFFQAPFCVDELVKAVRACLECPESGPS